MNYIYQNIYGFNAFKRGSPMSGCPAHKSIVSAVETGIKADGDREPYCGTIEYVMDGNLVLDIIFHKRASL